jgi:hypothetical protein
LITRKDYLAGSAYLHRAYFAQFVTTDTREAVKLAIGLDRLRTSTDAHLNDIPLHEWDALVGYPGDTQCSPPAWRVLLPIDRAAIKAAGEVISCSTLICIAKEAARQLIETSKED